MRRIGALVELVAVVGLIALRLTWGATAGPIVACALACGRSAAEASDHVCCRVGGNGERGGEWRTCPQERLSPVPSPPAVLTAPSASVRPNFDSMLELVSAPAPLSLPAEVPDPVPLRFS